MASTEQPATNAHLLLNDDFSDMTIRCRGEEFPVHKAVVCSTSSVLYKLCKLNMRESKESVIEHTELDAATVKRMLEFVYKYTYSLPIRAPSKSPNERSRHDGPNTANDILIAHVHVYAIADYYDIPSLREVATSNFIQQAMTDFQIKGFIEVVREIYEYTAEDEEIMRPALRGFIFENIDAFCADTGFASGLSEGGKMQLFAEEVLHCVVKNAETDRSNAAASQQRLEKQVKDLQRQLDAQKEQHDYEIWLLESTHKEATDDAKWRHEEELAHETEKVDGLIDQLWNLPTRCRNTGCDESFGKFSVSRKDDDYYGEERGSYEMRCHCNARIKPSS